MTGLLPDPTADALRRALGAQYEVLGLLGKGGMGAVYRAREQFLERDVAVKVLPSELASGDARERFLREARTAARLSHPNIVPLHTFGQAGDLLYYVMGFVDGESLEARIRREGKLPLDYARRIMAELADALHYAHQSGVVHRDVKPDNVLLDRATGHAMLTDFGIAKQRAALETLTQTGVIVGTPHYMSPEQASGDRDIDGRSDIYALGVIGYRMATGRLPFEGNGLREVLAQHATRTPVSPTQLVPGIPPVVEHVIMRAMAKDPLARWPNARAIRDALLGDGEDSVPEPLQDITGMGVRLGLIAAVLLEGAYLTPFFSTDRVLPFVIAGASLFTFALGHLGLIRPAKRYGMRAALHHFYQQPRWWTTWYPRFGRRSNDVWDRLPRDVRLVRSLNGFGMLANVALLNALFYGMSQDVLTHNPGFMRHFTWISLTVVGSWMLMLVPASRRFMKFAKKMGLSQTERIQAFQGPTWGSFWNRPHVAALLAPEAHNAAIAAPATTADLHKQIDALARSESASPHADLYREAATAAATIHAAFVALDAELAQLTRDSDPRELERIRESLKALGARDASESAAKSQMRDLLDRQEALFRDIIDRREQVARRRDRLVEQLRTLALQVAHLRSADSPATTSDITARIRAVCREMDYRIEGAREVNVLGK